MTIFIFCLRWVRFFFYTTLVIGALAMFMLSILVFTVARDLPKLPQPLSRIMETPRTEIISTNGQRLMSLGNRETVPLSRISSHFIRAVVATEDHRFWEHHGINKLRTVKALYITLFKPGKIQGASTITQQLAKNLFFSFKQSYMRKFKELLVAFQMEATNSKEEILHAYINQIYFGAGAQGVELAARLFFDKPAAELSLGEAALLAGLPKSPTRYNPYKHYDRALNRRNLVLKRMAAVGYISMGEAGQAMKDRPVLNQDQGRAGVGSYFMDTIINTLIRRYGEEVVYHGGIRVTTTMDPLLQAQAEAAVKNGLERLDGLMGLDDPKSDLPQGALVAVDTASGAIKAMVGGRNYAASQFNRAVLSRRQPGSGFKPFLYYTAIKDFSFSGATVMTDRPVTIPVKGAMDWEPMNFNRQYLGDMILKKALTHSVNSIAAQLVEMTGPGLVVDTANSCGITSPLEPVYSVALGTSGVTPLDMASAFATFATGGIRHEPFMIWRVEDSMARIIDEHIVRGKRVLHPKEAYQVVDMMGSVIDRGSARRVRKLGFSRPAGGKTGTTDSYNDAWFTGFTPSISTSVWTGFDKRRKLETKEGFGITGGLAAAPVWTRFMEAALKGEPVRDFPVPAGIRFARADSVTGCAAVEGSTLEVFKVPLKEDQTLCLETPE